MIKKIISIALIALLVISAIPFNVLAKTEPLIKINKLYLKAGNQLQVDNPNNYTLRYYVGDTEIESDNLTLSSDYYEKWITVTAYNGGEKVAEDKAYFSKLPVVYINTADGQSVTSKEEYKTADMAIQNNETCDKEIYNGTIDIRGRGNTTWSVYPKKPYKIKLDKKTDLFGMGKSKHWVLLANYLDNSFMRNVNASRLSHELGVETMDSVWTDVVLNGEYVGNYLLSEQVRIGSTRVDIFDWEEEAGNVASAISKAEKNNGIAIDKSALEDALIENLSWITSDKFTFNDKQYTISDYYTVENNIDGGFLFESSEEYDELTKFTTSGGLKVMVKSPEYLYTNDTMMDYAQRFWNNLEKAYKSETGYVKINGKNTHYTELADLDSMVGFWLVNEILGNNDAVYKSRYFYKPIGEKLKFGPTWDFDYGCGSFTVGDYPYAWKMSKNTLDDVKDANFYKELLDDPLFIAKATEKYWQVRPYLQTLINDGGVIDTDVEYLTESGVADNAIWDRGYIYGNRARTYEEDTKAYKSFLKERINWLDKQFDTDNDLINSTRVSGSAYPYVNAKEKIKVGLKNVAEDTSEHAPSDGTISSNRDLSLNVNVTDEDTKELKVYVNGLFYSSVDVINGNADFKVSKEKLSAPYDKKNVISFIGKDEQGDTTYKTFTTVKTFYEEEDNSGFDNADVFVPDKEDANIEKFELNVNVFRNFELLGLQLKADKSAAVRFVTVAQSDVLSKAKDYGYIFCSETTEHNIDDVKQNINRYLKNGRYVSCKGSSNTVSMANYGNSVVDKNEEGYTNYKYITASLSNIPNDKYIISAFYIKTNDKTYIATYKENQQACVFKIDDLIS